jgi:hypothetical protein
MATSMLLSYGCLAAVDAIEDFADVVLSTFCQVVVLIV